jgi:hypothetical protein
MATTLAELEQRLRALEAEVAALREEMVNGSSGTEPPALTVVRRSPSPASPRALDAGIQAVYHEMGISRAAPGIEQLRALLAAQGVLPGDEVVRQEIAAMRDQEEEKDE